MRGARKSPKGVPLARALSKLGACSRTEAIALIRQGRVRLGTRIVRDPSLSVVPEAAFLSIDGKRIQREGLRVLAVHKPRGLVTTRSDEKGRVTIYSALSDVDGHLIPVGRLDMATSGLLLMTNDSRLAAWLTDPHNKVRREYAVTVRGALSDEEARRLESGIQDNGEELHAAAIVIQKRSARETHLFVQLTEGKNREIRRLFASCAHEVTRLKRIAFGGVALGDLPSGKWRELELKELERAFPGAPLRTKK